MSGCGKSQQMITYDLFLTQIKQDCIKKGGDSLKPYGADAWYSIVNTGHPLTFKCKRFGKVFNRTVALYFIRTLPNDKISLEIR